MNGCGATECGSGSTLVGRSSAGPRPTVDHRIAASSPGNSLRGAGDRLGHHCEIVTIRGNSYRVWHHADLHRALGAPRQDLAHQRSRTRVKEGAGDLTARPSAPSPVCNSSPVKVRNSVPVLTA